MPDYRWTAPQLRALLGIAVTTIRGWNATGNITSRLDAEGARLFDIDEVKHYKAQRDELAGWQALSKKVMDKKLAPDDPQLQVSWLRVGAAVRVSGIPRRLIDEAVQGGQLDYKEICGTPFYRLAPKFDPGWATRKEQERRATKQKKLRAKPLLWSKCPLKDQCLHGGCTQRRMTGRDRYELGFCEHHTRQAYEILGATFEQA